MPFYGRENCVSKSCTRSITELLLLTFFSTKKVIAELEAIRRDFVWGKKNGRCKMRWVAWDKLVKVKDYGGLGIGDIRSANLALLAKWWWKYKQNNGALWAKVIDCIHLKPKSVSMIPSKNKLSGVWNDICSVEKAFEAVGLSLKTNLVVKLGNGKNTRFWLDAWLENQALKDRFPAIYKLAKDKQIKVDQCARMGDNTVKWSWEWSRGLRSNQEKVQYEELEKILKDYKRETSDDVWRWKLRHNEDISVAILRDAYEKTNIDITDLPWKHWNKWVPPKVNLFVWRTVKRRIAVKVELARRGIQLGDRTCSRCNNEEETVEHLLLNCLKSRAIWWNIMLWLKLPVQEGIESCEEILDRIDNFNGSKVWKTLIKAIVMTSMWQIWKSRNEVEFNRKEGSISNTMDGIKELSYLWIKERAKMKDLVWERWKDFNVRDIIK
ncbi:putative reverse transcriptase zinc-binding domain-containing protein [Helianthus annuus]|nr:putative reverse transcriptase zinc-binding domain-containing protein [Helianthus annuus]